MIAHRRLKAWAVRWGRAAVIAAAAAFVAPANAEDPSRKEELVPFAVAGPDGFGISSADGASRLITHWLLESDLRAFVGDDAPTLDRESFMLKFAGIRLDAQLERTFRAAIFANFAQNQVTVLEGWIEARLAPWLRIRAGKVLYPISEERLTPVINLPFVSNSIAAMLLPARDTGVELLGSSSGGEIAFNLAVTNGATPGGAGDVVSDTGKDGVARVFAHPLASTGFTPLQQLGIGLGASTGRHNGTPDNPRLMTLQTYGGQTFFSYARGAVATGRVQRLVPHATWALGPVSVFADGVLARDSVNGIDVPSRAWSATATWVLTGEPSVPFMFVIPSRPFDLASGHIGAVELAFSTGEISVGSNAFPAVMDPAASMRKMSAVGGSLNWYPSRGVAFLVSYGHQVFTAAASAAARPTEDTLIARLELIL